MAARRLIIVLLVLFAFSIAAAMIAPDRRGGLIGGSSSSSESTTTIEIPAFGVTESAAPDAPAGFNLLLRESGRLAILDADSGELLGRLDVREPGKRNGTNGQRRPSK